MIDLTTFLTLSPQRGTKVALTEKSAEKPVMLSLYHSNCYKTQTLPFLLFLH